jgi:polysaccharide chain length determinant protein (PEP-CTERM system associated)
VSETEVGSTDIISQVLGMVRRHRWWILGAAFAVPLATIGVVLQLRDRYTSDATIMAVQQQVSQKYVDPVNTMTTPEIVNSMSREVMSRSRLLAIIDSFALYPKERASTKPDQLAELMRKDIDVTPLDVVKVRGDNTFTAFTLSFTAENPRLAQEVASRLTSLFIEESLKTQSNQASGTAKFLSEQLEAARQRLQQQEQRLSEFKMRNLAELPEQASANLDGLKELRLQLQNVMSNRARAQQQLGALESLLSVDLARLQTEKSQLLTRYTAKNPEVVKRDGEIARVQDLLSQLKSGKAGAPKPPDALASDDPRMAQMRIQAEANLADAESLAKEEARLRADIAQDQARLRLTPVREQQLTGILREYELYKHDYADLQNKQLQSQLTANLEGQQEGQRFRLVDPPTLPAFPSGPKRVRISLGAVGGGLAFGVVLAFLLDMRNRSFHDEKEVKRHFGAPLIVGVPLFRTRREDLWRRWRLAFEWLAACAISVVVVAAEVFVFLRDGWV